MLVMVFFANCEIPKHEFFGPYLGKIIEAKDAKNYEESHYTWEVSSFVRVTVEWIEPFTVLA